LNAHVVGVSGDKAAAQIKFVERYGLSFPMVPDPQKRIIGAYGAMAVLGLAAKRPTFLVAPDGRIAHVWPSVKLAGHAEDVVAKITRLSAGQ